MWRGVGQTSALFQIMYNRALVQLGLCAFRHGNIRDAHNALLDIQSGGRAKEMLAQVRDAAAFAPAWIARKLVGALILG